MFLESNAFANDVIAIQDHSSGNSSVYLAHTPDGGVIISTDTLPSLYRLSSSGERNYIFLYGGSESELDERTMMFGGLVGSGLDSEISKSYTNINTQIQVTPNNEGMIIGGVLGFGMSNIAVDDSYSKGNYSINGEYSEMWINASGLYFIHF